MLPNLMQKYPGLTFSFEGRQADRRESMQSLITGLIYALFVIYAMLAVPFNSYVQPMIIMFSIPFGFVGAILGHLIMGYSLCIPSMNSPDIPISMPMSGYLSCRISAAFRAA